MFPSIGHPRLILIQGCTGSAPNNIALLNTSVAKTSIINDPGQALFNATFPAGLRFEKNTCYTVVVDNYQSSAVYFYGQDSDDSSIYSAKGIPGSWNNQNDFAVALWGNNMSETSPTAPTITWNSANPKNLTIFSAIAKDYNVSYTISPTDTYAVNASSARLYYKTNNSNNNITYYINGVSYSGYFIKAESSNVTSNFTFSIDDNDVYPATYNVNLTIVETQVHTATILSGINDAVRIRLYNVTSTANISFFEFMVNSSTGIPLNIYYCNSSYDLTQFKTSASCANFFSFFNQPYNHTHGLSAHHVIPFRSTAGKIQGIGITSTSYFIFTPASHGSWNVYKTAAVTDQSNSMTTSNNGNAWSNAVGTYDAHLHQFTDATFYHYAYACSNSGACATSTLTSELIDAENLPPIPPIVFQPNSSATYNGQITINWTNSTPQSGKTISNYIITLIDSSFTVVDLIGSTTSNGINYVTTQSGVYYVIVTANDSIGLQAYGISSNFTLDNQVPEIMLMSPQNNSKIIRSIDSTIIINTPFTVNFSDNIMLYDYNLSVYNASNKSMIKIGGLLSGTSQQVSPSFDIQAWGIGTFYEDVRVCDAHTGSLTKEAITTSTNNSLTFRYPEGYVTILSLNGDEEMAETIKLYDRYTFKFKYKSDSTTHKYRILTDMRLDYIKGSKYAGHFVIGGLYWLDFEPAKTYDVKFIDGAYEITIYDKKKEMSFSSIGELNCVEQRTSFTIDYESSLYNEGILSSTNWFNFDAINTGTTAGVMIIIFLFMVFVFLVWMAESMQIPFFALFAGLYGFFIGYLMFTIISAIMGTVLVVIAIGYIVRSFVMAK
jgi:hypothetical protein